MTWIFRYKITFKILVAVEIQQMFGELERNLEKNFSKISHKSTKTANSSSIYSFSKSCYHKPDINIPVLMNEKFCTRSTEEGGDLSIHSKFANWWLILLPLLILKYLSVMVFITEEGGDLCIHSKFANWWLILLPLLILKYLSVIVFIFYSPHFGEHVREPEPEQHQQ